LAKLRGETIRGPLPALDGGAAAEAHERVRLLVNSGALSSAHDVSEGGLAIAIAESCIAGEIGARVTLPPGFGPFAEAPGRAFVVSGPEAALTGLPIIGRVGGDALEIDGLVNLAVSVLRDARARGLSQYL
jgi:phosphoribosylformylglycinamidine synthase